MQLAKPAMDVGLYTNQLSEHLTFWQHLSVPYGELLPVGNGVRQHRHVVGQSILKVNHAREALPTVAPAGLRALHLELPEQATLPIGEHQDPDGNVISLTATTASARLRLSLVVSDLARHQHFYGTVLGLPTDTDAQTFVVGESRIHLIEGPATQDPVQRAVGLRYMTFQVFDVRAEHQAVLSQGGAEGMAPLKLGDVAHISFVRDPDGNWIELSQRKSITGSLGD